VTGYKDPDLDGTACMIVYSELLKKQGINATCGYFGNLQQETLYLLEKFKIPQPKEGNELIEECEKIIIVDNINPANLSHVIDPKRVVEIIDHHCSEKKYLKCFPNARYQIESVGAAATLIVEKYVQSGLTISKNHAALLYGAIVSNTLNFKSNTTTERDRKAAGWLKDFVDIPDSFTRDMFAAKSDLRNKDIYHILLGDLKERREKSLLIAQIEIIELKKTIKEREKEFIKALERIRKERKSKYTFLTAIDLEKGFNMFVAVDNETIILLEKSLGVSFDGNIAKREGILMRKKIIPIIEKHI